MNVLSILSRAGVHGEGREEEGEMLSSKEGSSRGASGPPESPFKSDLCRGKHGKLIEMMLERTKSL